MDKILIVYYSRTGTTKKVAEVIKSRLNCDIEEINSIKNRSSIRGYFLCGKEAISKKPAEIKPSIKNPKDYDLVIIGTPIWGWNLSSPVRAYLFHNTGKFRKIACFCTMGGSGAERAFSEIERICKIKPIADFAVLTKDANNCEKSLEEFI